MTADRQGELFHVESPPVRTPKRATGNGKPRWTQYKVKYPMKCDDCMLILAQAKGVGPASRVARFRRAQDGADLLLCIAHAQDRRDIDGMKPLEIP
jgi:hypothetical protein